MGRGGGSSHHSSSSHSSSHHSSSSHGSFSSGGGGSFSSHRGGSSGGSHRGGGSSSSFGSSGRRGGYSSSGGYYGHWHPYSRTNVYVGRNPVGTFVAMMILIFVFVIVGRSMTSSDHAITYQHEKLQNAYVNENTLIQDELNWVGTDSTKVRKGMDYFANKTGIQPYLIICDNIDGKGGNISDSEAETYLETVYQNTFEDDGHLIFCFMEYEDSEYITYLYAGKTASTLMDSEAQEAFYRQVDRLYTNSSLSDEEYFARIFTDAADAIMRDPNSGRKWTFAIAGVLGIVAVVGIVAITKVKKAKAEAEKAEHYDKAFDAATNSKKDDHDPLEEKYR